MSMNIIKFYDGQINSLEYTVKFHDRVVLLASKYLVAETGNVPIDAALLQPVLSEIYTFEK